MKFIFWFLITLCVDLIVLLAFSLLFVTVLSNISPILFTVIFFFLLVLTTFFLGRCSK